MKQLTIFSLFMILHNFTYAMNCATPEMSFVKKLELLDVFAQMENEQLYSKSKKEINIPVVVHYSNPKIIEIIDEQMIILNDNFANTGFKFYLQKLNEISNPKWRKVRSDMKFQFDNYWTDNSTVQEMKANLREGDKNTLNLYITNVIDKISWASFPFYYDNDKYDVTQDGIVLSDITVKGFTDSDIYLGRTLAHEVGHWLGLFHTFSSLCGEPGDLISDTNEHTYRYTWTCNKNDEKFGVCNDNEIAPIRNYMNYVLDSCKSNFTPLQIKRMKGMYKKYREEAEISE